MTLLRDQLVCALLVVAGAVVTPLSTGINDAVARPAITPVIVGYGSILGSTMADETCFACQSLWDDWNACPDSEFHHFTQAGTPFSWKNDPHHSSPTTVCGACWDHHDNCTEFFGSILEVGLGRSTTANRLINVDAVLEQVVLFGSPTMTVDIRTASVDLEGCGDTLLTTTFRLSSSEMARLADAQLRVASMIAQE